MLFDCKHSTWLFRDAEGDGPTITSPLGFSVRECSQGLMIWLGRGPASVLERGACVSRLAHSPNGHCGPSGLSAAETNDWPQVRETRRVPVLPSSASLSAWASSCRADTVLLIRWENDTLPSPGAGCFRMKCSRCSPPPPRLLNPPAPTAPVCPQERAMDQKLTLLLEL